MGPMDDMGPAEDMEPVIEVPEFCLNYEATCGEWPIAETTCTDWWNSSAAGVEGDPSGASQACYSYHFGVAAGQDEGSDARAL